MSLDIRQDRVEQMAGMHDRVSIGRVLEYRISVLRRMRRGLGGDHTVSVAQARLVREAQAARQKIWGQT